MVSPNTVEWLVATADRDIAARLLRRNVEWPGFPAESLPARLRAFARGWSSGPGRDGLETVRDNLLSVFGWISRVHGLVDPASLSPPPRD